MKNILVIGGGMAGQLVQLAIPTVQILDWRKAPMNHLDTRSGPQYLWEPIPGVQSFSFPVVTLVDSLIPTPDRIRAYKKKIGKEEDGGDWGLQFQHEMTGYHSYLPVPRVEYNKHVKGVDLAQHCLMMADDQVIGYDQLISTIPLDFFLKLCSIPPLIHSQWKSNPIYMSHLVDHTSQVKGMILNYLSDVDNPVYRETSTHEGMFFESLEAIASSKKILPGKIHPHPESEHVLRALRIFDVQCFGRYATWRPDELAHDTWKKIVAWRDA